MSTSAGTTPAAPGGGGATNDDATDARVQQILAELEQLLGQGLATRAGAAGLPALVAFAAGEAATRRLRGALAALDAKPADAFPKLAYVSFYSIPDKAGRPRFRVSFKVPGHRRRTDRLGRDGAKAYKWARFCSETIEQVRSRTLKAEEAYRLLHIDRMPIDSLVTEYERHLKTKGVSDQYRKTTLFRIRQCLELAGVTRVDTLTKKIVPDLLEQLRKREAGPGKVREIVEQTVNAYLNDLRKFTRWLARKDKVVRDPLENAEGVKVTEEKGRRRDAAPEDVKWICAAAMADKDPTGAGKRRMPGADRAMLYLVAYSTGFRRKELRAAEVSWLRLDAKDPKIVLPDKFAKNLNRAEQPLPTWLVAVLKTWLGGRAKGKLFERMPRDVIKLFRADRRAGRAAWLIEKGLTKEELKRRQQSDFLEYKTSDGVLVFHSLRHGFASALLDGGADLKLAQFLTRHSTITLLADRYGHVRRSKVNAAVEAAIPNPVADLQPKPEEPKK